ncbi:DUF167 domain-containing protein [Halodurantibacterium flavum]|uniref:UPF0235 protein ACFSGJ_04395 n=1 Tax=Halodurantibacterium flavum TaxID=1382802 RepID=A0ABW4S1T5_9RHOB
MPKAPPADLAHLAQPGAQITVRVTPRAARDAVILTEDGQIRITVTAVPEDGKANRVVTRLLARAMGVAPGRLTLVRGAAARDKTFRLLD